MEQLYCDVYDFHELELPGKNNCKLMKLINICSVSQNIILPRQVSRASNHGRAYRMSQLGTQVYLVSNVWYAEWPQHGTDTLTRRTLTRHNTELIDN